MSCILENAQKLQIPSAQVYNVPLEISTVDVAVPFTVKEIWFIV